jgi:uncharacterized phage protein (TIGR01671 family)
MREVKFRAWEKFLKEIIPVYNIDFVNGMINTESAWRLFHEFELMQYTGLNDKNGKEIYEGDIVEFNDFDSLRTGGHTEDNIIRNTVCFSCGAWIVKTENGFYDLYTAIVNDEELEVIGNIYENPELLEGVINE